MQQFNLANLTDLGERVEMEKTALSDFLYPHIRYRGQVKPENLVFNANLQEFSQQVCYICNLQTAGKLSTDESFEKIKSLWQQLKESRQHLGIGQ
jgi:hypothetical protein